MMKDAMLWSPGEGGKAVCALCSHRCVIAPSKYGVCGVRQNVDGRLQTYAYGEVIAAHVDPIEKKPLYHFYPGSKAFSVATVGCNFRCSFCQNWEISQPGQKGRGTGGTRLSPEGIVREARAAGCRSVSYTYTEPTIFFEYAFDTAKLAHDAGLANSFVTNGYITREALEIIRPWLDAANVDLKAFKDETYKKVCGARLAPVLDAIGLMKSMGIWVEVTTLVVPGLNDGDEELTAIARFIAGVDVDMPWHISRFHPDFQLTDTPPTPVGTLRRALALGQAEGLHHCYVGNISGESEDTRCPHCGEAVILRQGFFVTRNKIVGSRCPVCGQSIAGRFAD